VEVKLRVFLTAIIGGSELVYAPAVLPLVPLIFQTLVVILYTSQCVIVQNSTFCAQCTLCALRTNSCYFPTQHWLVFVSVTECLLRGTLRISTY